jgi:DinB family protein
MNPTVDPTDESPLEEPVDQPAQMVDGSDLLSRIDDATDRLAELARREAPSGLTDPEPGGDERWEAGQVWAHIAEFVPYWHDQIESVIGEYDGTPVPFGRTRTDPDRVAAIEMGRVEPIADTAARTAEASEAARRYLNGLNPVEWSAVGLHPVRGEMDVAQMVEAFLADHLEEHADQLDKLR